jgi:hypothetical protein
MMRDMPLPSIQFGQTVAMPVTIHRIGKAGATAAGLSGKNEQAEWNAGTIQSWQSFPLVSAFSRPLRKHKAENPATSESRGQDEAMFGTQNGE